MSWHFSHKKRAWKSLCLPICQTGKATVNLLSRTIYLFLSKQIWLGQQPTFEETWLLPSQHARTRFIYGIFRKATLFAHINLKQCIYLKQNKTKKKTKPPIDQRPHQKHINSQISAFWWKTVKKNIGSHVLLVTFSACFLAFQIPRFKNCRTREAGIKIPWNSLSGALSYLLHHPC